MLFGEGPRHQVIEVDTGVHLELDEEGTA